jgi:hypothetical protein
MQSVQSMPLSQAIASAVVTAAAKPAQPLPEQVGADVARRIFSLRGDKSAARYITEGELAAIVASACRLYQAAADKARRRW